MGERTNKYSRAEFLSLRINNRKKSFLPPHPPSPLRSEVRSSARSGRQPERFSRSDRRASSPPCTKLCFSFFLHFLSLFPPLALGYHVLLAKGKHVAPIFPFLPPTPLPSGLFLFGGNLIARADLASASLHLDIIFKQSCFQHDNSGWSCPKNDAAGSRSELPSQWIPTRR